MAAVNDTQENLARCLCGGCPSYTDCMSENSEGLFCARGKTLCGESSRDGCICAACPVYDDCDLSGQYYCFGGAA